MVIEENYEDIDRWLTEYPESLMSFRKCVKNTVINTDLLRYLYSGALF